MSFELLDIVDFQLISLFREGKDSKKFLSGNIFGELFRELQRFFRVNTMVLIMTPFENRLYSNP